MTTTFEPLAVSDFELRANARLDEGFVKVSLSGTADTRSMSALDGLLKRVHEQTRQLGLRGVVVDLRELEFMNSSCFKAFVTWVSTVQELPGPDQYKIEFLSDERRHWQRRSLGALACFAVDLITIST
jgi:hypothetical protein